ncbi:MAG: 50S ribosomal protein L20 [bacterium]
MARAKGGFKLKNRHKTWLKLAKGFCGRRSKIFKTAKLAVIHALTYAYVGRKKNKRNMRALWNVRIGAAAKVNGSSYSKLIFGLKQSSIELDRKVLAAIASEDAKTFASLVKVSQAATN